MSECGPEVMQALRPHRSALMGLAELATSNPHMRVFLRHVAEMQRRLEGAEREAQQWHTQCSAAEAQLQQARFEIEALQQQLGYAHKHHGDLQLELRAKAQAHAGAHLERQKAEEALGGDLDRCRAEVLRLGAQGMAQSRVLASEQAAMLAANQEISRLRVELEITGTSCRRQASDLEVARRQAAGADIEAEQASNERVRLEALLKHATREQHSELVSTTEQATAEAARMRRKVEGGREELQGVRKVLTGLEGTLAEIQSLAPSALAAAEFIHDPETAAAQQARSHEVLAPGGPPPVRMPVLALRWGPGIGLDTTPVLTALRTDGLFGLFHQLATGAKQPEQVELTICFLHGRWFCTREEEAAHFAALLAYQALHRDAPVQATCRVGSPHSLLNPPTAGFTGLGVRSVNALWRTPPLDDEDFLRLLVAGTPLKDRLEAFFYEQRRGRVHEALREEAQRDPVGSVLPSAAAAAPRGGSAGGEPHRAAARPLYGGSGRPRNVI